MTAPVRQYVAMFVVGLVAAGAALCLLLLSRLVQPGSRIVRRGLLPDDHSLLAPLVKAVSFDNARGYFGFDV